MMNTFVWFIQGILALMFAMGGLLKMIKPKDNLQKTLPWVNDYSLQTVRLIGVSEFLGAIGMIVPQLTGILPVLTPIAASGLAIIMILAAFHHFRRNETKEGIFNAVLYVLLSTVIFYRFYYPVIH